MGRPKDTTQYTEKRCVHCGITKPLNELVKGKRSTMGRKGICKACEAKRQLAAYHANPEPRKAKCRELSNLHQRRWNLKRIWGLTPEQYDEILRKQDGVCAICGQPPSGKKGEKYLHIDHCHDSDVIRGLLCGNCNNGIGRFKDSPTNLRRAAQYIERNSPTLFSQTIPKRRSSTRS